MNANYSKYLQFIEECKIKVYDKCLVLHKHHIIPRHMGGSNEDINLVKLSVEDHINAHILLSECFDENTYERISNLRSARFIAKNSIKLKDDLNLLINDTYKGSNNPFYGKTHTEENCKKFSENASLQYKNKSYADRYGSNAELEKKKRVEGVKNWWDNNQDMKKIRGKKVSDSLKMSKKVSRGNNPAAYPILVDGVRYECYPDALEALNISKYKLKKYHKIEKLKK